jgi:hypothetical protein
MYTKSQFDLSWLGPLSKGFETNLKLLTNKNARFHWTLLLGTLSKVGLSNTALLGHYVADKKSEASCSPAIGGLWGSWQGTGGL